MAVLVISLLAAGFLVLIVSRLFGPQVLEFLRSEARQTQYAFGKNRYAIRRRAALQAQMAAQKPRPAIAKSKRGKRAKRRKGHS